MIKKLVKNEHNENTIVHVKVRPGDGKEYECVGVLMEDNSKYIRVAFNAREGVVKDDIKFYRDEILEIKILKANQLNEIE